MAVSTSAPPRAHGASCDECGVCASVRDWSTPDAHNLLVHMIRSRVEEGLRGGGSPPHDGRTVPIGVSARHVHLSPEHVETLLGPRTPLEPVRDLLQPGEFATDHSVSVVGPSGRVLERVRILGPTRPRTQIELSRTDGVGLAMNLPMRRSGDLEGTPEVTLVGPRGTVRTDGAIRAARHVHASPEDAARLGVGDGDEVAVRIPGPEGLTFPAVQVRTHPGWILTMHLDTDDANASGVNCVTHGVVLV
jgi:propanediol utilization protein